MPSLTRKIPHGSPMARKILRECEMRIRQSEREMSSKLAKWSEAEDKALAYIPEREVDKLRRHTREGGLPEYTTIQIPYSYAVLMSAHTYLTSVFMGRSPIYQFAGRHGETEDQCRALESIIDYQLFVGKVLVPLYIWLYDSAKYGAGIVECFWEDRIESFTTLQEESQIDPITGVETREKVQTSRFISTYKGNRVRNVQPQDFLWDTRFPIWAFQEGEYCAKRFAVKWNDIIRREKQGFYTNVEHITSKANADTGHSIDSALERPEVNDPRYQTYELSELNTKHPSMVKGYEVYVELIPKEWGLGSSDYPEKWVFTVTADYHVLIGAQPLGALHCKYPFSVLCLEPEGYGLTVRGITEILEPVQNTVDWLINSHFYNIRASLNNMMVVDPSRVMLKDLVDPRPGKLIRLKPEAYGTDVKLAVHQFQVQDVTRTHLQDLQMMLGIGERTVGINDQIMGMLNAGGRKTATEVRTSTSFGVNRLKTIAEFYSISGFDPLAQILVQNTQQYYDMRMKFKIAGSHAMANGGQFMDVTPETIAGFYSFVPVDGTLPIDRYAQMNIWLQMFAQIQRMPAILAQYDLARVFEFVAQLGGLKNIDQFRIDVRSDKSLMQQAAAGNVVPMKGAAAGAAAGDGATSPEIGQIPNMGATG